MEAMDKVREMGGIGVIIGEILCLFAFIPFPLLLLHHKLWINPQINYADTSIGVDLKRITIDLDSGYRKVKLSEASWNKLNFGGSMRYPLGQRCK